MRGSFGKDRRGWPAVPSVLPANLPQPQLTEEFFGVLSRHLGLEGRRALATTTHEDVARALAQLSEDVTDPTSEFWAQHASLDKVAEECFMHPKSLLVALKASLTKPITNLPKQGRHGKSSLSNQGVVAPDRKSPPALAVLARNVPILILQVLAPALVAQQPVVFKLPTDCATFPVAVLHALFQLLPPARNAFAALSWQGGGNDGAVESHLGSATPGFRPILVYGNNPALERYSRHTGRDNIVKYGPKVSAALIVDDGSEHTPAWLALVARDIALFEQRGCLSVRAVLLVCPATVAKRRAQQLANALERLAKHLPLPTSPAAEGAQARHWIDGAVLQGNPVHGELSTGGAVVCTSDFAPAPGARSVNLVAQDTLELALDTLREAAPHLQGIALCIEDAELEGTVRQRLAQLNVQRVVPAGSLQETSLLWSNAGIDLVQRFTAPAP